MFALSTLGLQPGRLSYELKKYEDISYIGFPIQHFDKEFFYHLNGNMLHKLQESAASAVGDKHQVGGGGGGGVKVQHKCHHFKCA